jgi:glycosyltransferase involved in cell wall biosynthesis
VVALKRLIKVAAFVSGDAVPSARFRVRQYIAALREMGISFREMRTHTTAYPPSQRILRPAWAAARLVELTPAVARSRHYDCVFLQRSMVSSFVTLEAWTGRPRVFDVDDAIHLRRGGEASRRLAAISHTVIAGNSWLADWYYRWNRNVVILPTAVDSDVYRPIPQRPDSEVVTVGWIGTSSNHPYLLAIEDAICDALEAQPRLSLKVVSDRPPPFRRLDRNRWTFVRWSEADEVQELQSMEIGIMPLADSDWARGKCSFKMLQYMACGIPVVVSPVGMNLEVLAQAELGIAATNRRQWADALCDLVASAELRAQMGSAGRQVVERRYATAIVAKELGNIISKTAGLSLPAVRSNSDC